MAKASKRAVPDRLEAGWAKLREGRWEAPRAAFAKALALEETPEAHEGLSWAAWWLDDAEAVFVARERAYHLYSTRGDAGSAARMATWPAAGSARFPRRRRGGERADRQRCTLRRLRNVLAKVPERERERVKAAYRRALDEASSAEDGERRLRKLFGELADQGYAAAAACLADDLEALCAHLRYPLKHRRVWRSANLLERSLGELKRRTKVIGRFPGETSCLSLCWAVLDLAIAGSNRVRFDDLDRQLIGRIRAGRERGDVAQGEGVAAA